MHKRLEDENDAADLWLKDNDKQRKRKDRKNTMNYPYLSARQLKSRLSHELPFSCMSDTEIRERGL